MPALGREATFVHLTCKRLLCYRKRIYINRFVLDKCKQGIFYVLSNKDQDLFRV
jgi:hypothetical protein